MKAFSLEEHLKNPNRKVVTRNERSARIICTDAKGNYPIVALIEEGGYDNALSYTKDGKLYVGETNGYWNLYGEESDIDLFFAPEKHEGWVNVYRDFDGLMCGSVFATEEDAKCNAKTAIATIKIEWEE